MVGFGLESLIPKKNKPDESGKTSFSNIAPPTSGRLETFSGTAQIKRKPHGYRPFFRTAESVFQIEVERIKPNPYQPRRDFNEGGLTELAQSIREFGIIQPLVVSKIIKETEFGTQVEYQLIAGERRLMAAKLVGLERVPAIVKKIHADKDKLEIALIENIQRSNLNPIETAKAYARLQDEFNLTQREIAARVGKSREVIANTLRLLGLPSKIQEALTQNKINESQARAILAAGNLELQERLFQSFLAQKLSIRSLKEKTHSPSDPEKTYWEKQLEEKLGAPVKVVKHGNHGRMVIQFYSEDEWQTILKKLLGEELG